MWNRNGNRGKYGASKTPREIEGRIVVFDSKKEAKRYDQLAALQSSGKIRALDLQPEYELQPGFVGCDGKKVRAIVYRGDFEYEELQKDGTWELVTEDVKGMRPPEYRLKAKMFEYMTGRKIRET